MRKLILLLVILTAGIISQAQVGKAKITGTVVDGNTKTIESATITLLRQTDSAVVKMSVADKTGKYVFESIPAGKYLVSITAVGHSKGFSEPIEVNGEIGTVTVKTVELVPVGKNLAGVTVSSRKPLVEQKIDRTIVNVDAAASNVGATALEVLEKAPGVTVDKDGNISLKGKQGVQVYIDGRASYLSGTDLANYLRSLNASQLETLEIMTNPPAKYDAAGNSGIINIKTKKTKQVGYSGSLSSNYSQGFYPKFNESANFNYRKNKVNLFANLGYSNRKNYNQLNIQRQFVEPVTKMLISHFDQYSRFNSGGKGVNGKMGMDYFASKKTTLGVVINGLSNKEFLSNNGEVYISDAGMNPVSKTNSLANNERNWKHLGANLNFRHVFDSAGQELTADADYLSYNTSSTQELFNYYYKANGGTSPKPDSLLGNLPQNIKIYSARMDYTLPLAKNAKLEAGLKTSFVRTDNDAQYDSLNNGIIVRDMGRSNHFLYEENINAAYVNYTRPLSKKITAQIGLRLENTNAEGRQLTTGEKFTRNYTQLFPTAFVQYAANEKHSFVLNYGRRIERPNYQDMNPFMVFIDKYTFEQGNPNLNPQFSHNVELKHTYKNFLNTTLNYSYTNDIIEDVLQQDPNTTETKIMKSNIAKRQQFGLSVSAGGQIKKWWTANLWTNLYNNRYEGVVNGQDISVNGTTAQVNLYNQFKFSKTWSADISGFYTSPLVDGVFMIKGFGKVDIGISKQVLKGKGTVRLSGRDIFFTQKFRGEANYADVNATFQQHRDSRQVAVGFTYRFSKGKVNGSQKRKTGAADDEKSRVNSGGEN